jgi:arylsulfatase A-like enzyme
VKARVVSAHSVAPLCNPTRYPILTGHFPSRNFLPNERAAPGEPAGILQNTRLNPDTPCIADMLGQANYFTGFVGKWHSTFALKALGIDKLPPAR